MPESWSKIHVRPIVKDDIEFLSQPSEPASEADTLISEQLLNTIYAHADECVGMAANMIGSRRRIIVANVEKDEYLVMFNPEIIKCSGPYEAEEGCLSLTGTRKAKRYKSIKVRWDTPDMKPRIKTFTGWPAQIIQHEIDHCNGIII